MDIAQAESATVQIAKGSALKASLGPKWQVCTVRSTTIVAVLIAWGPTPISVVVGTEAFASVFNLPTSSTPVRGAVEYHPRLRPEQLVREPQAYLLKEEEEDHTLHTFSYIHSL